MIDAVLIGKLIVYEVTVGSISLIGIYTLNSLLNATKNERIRKFLTVALIILCSILSCSMIAVVLFAITSFR